MKVLNTIAQTTIATVRLGVGCVGIVTKAAHETFIITDAALTYSSIKTAHRLDKDCTLARITKKDVTLAEVIKQGHDNDHKVSKLIDGRIALKDLMQEVVQDCSFITFA